MMTMLLLLLRLLMMMLLMVMMKMVKMMMVMVMMVGAGLQEETQYVAAAVSLDRRAVCMSAPVKIDNSRPHCLPCMIV